MLKEEEVYVRPQTFLNRDGFATHIGANGHYYCGQPVLDCNCCNGICGPSYGCNCSSCQEIEEDLKENTNASNYSLPKEQLESWAWGNPATISDLRIFAKLISHKQLAFFKHFVDSEVATKYFKTNLYVFARFLAAYSKSYQLPAKKAPLSNDVTKLTKEVSKKYEALLFFIHFLYKCFFFQIFRHSILDSF